jgi:hypothetical protein
MEVPQGSRRQRVPMQSDIKTFRFRLDELSGDHAVLGWSGQQVSYTKTSFILSFQAETSIKYVPQKSLRE